MLFDYDKALKDELMTMAGQGGYRYNGSTKRWSYRRGFHTNVVSILSDYEYDIIDSGEYTGPVGSYHSYNSQSVHNPWDAVFDSMEVPLGSKVYRALVMAVHPDKGGDTTTMQLVNDAWARRNDG